MKTNEFFARHPVFTTSELTACLENRNHWTRKNLLAYHCKQGHIVQITRGLYAVVTPGRDSETYAVDPYLLAAKAAPDAVLAYHTALEVHGKAHSIFQQFFFLSRVPPRPRTFRAQRFRGISFPKALRLAGKEDFDVGVLDRSGVSIRVTSLERTLVDVLDRPDLGGGWEEIWRSLESVEYFDLDRVLEYARLLGNRTTAAKVGFYLEQHAEALMVEDRHLEPLRALRPKQPHYLERGKSGKLAGRWNLVVPSSLYERAWEQTG